MEPNINRIKWICRITAHAYRFAYEEEDKTGMKIYSAKLEGIEKMLEILNIPHINIFDNANSYNLCDISFN